MTKRTTRRRLPRRILRQIEEAARVQEDRVRDMASRLHEAQRRSHVAADLQREAPEAEVL